MIKIDFKEPDTKKWQDWKTECQREQLSYNESIERDETPDVKTEVYKGTKYNIKSDVYMNLRGPFNGKCAYCESLINADQPGDIEHFRPKNEVKDKHNNQVMINIKGELQPHPGYYWLTYDYTNLLPSCRDCNKIPKKVGPSFGKGNQFPVENFRATKPGEEIDEKPLLINPIFENPEEHLELDETGVLYARTDKGQACINIFGLNLREALVEIRKDTYDNIKDKVDALILNWMSPSGENINERLTQITDILKGKKAYSVAGRLAIEKRAPVLKQILSLENSE